MLTSETLLTVRKTPAGAHPPYDPAEVRQAARPDDSTGMLVYRLLDDIAERYLDLVDDLDSEIDELEDKVESQPAPATRERVSSLRQGPEVFPHDVEVAFNAAYDKLMRALDGLELSRDLLSSVRDYQQAKIANDQNEVTKRLTATASLLLVPTFIVGLYGQNFRHIPELRWHWGYEYVWALILVTTGIQLWWYRRNHWF